MRLLHLLNRLRSYSQDAKAANKNFACVTWVNNTLTMAIIFELIYSVSHIITYPSKELCSKMALGEGGVSLP